MRTASILYLILALTMPLQSAVSWAFGAQFAITLFMVIVLTFFVVLAIYLWRGRRWAAVTGAITAVLSLVALSFSAYSLWPLVKSELGQPRYVLDAIISMLVPIALTASITIILMRALVHPKGRISTRRGL